MSVDLPDPETFGEPRERCRDGTDTDDYHSLFDFEADEDEDEDD